ncbi:MAG: hypothetical protein AB2L18_06245 [Anaerolineaceae bacterium]
MNILLLHLWGGGDGVILNVSEESVTRLLNPKTGCKNLLYCHAERSEASVTHPALPRISRKGPASYNNHSDIVVVG